MSFKLVGETKDQWKQACQTQEDMFMNVLNKNMELESEIVNLKDRIELLESGRRELKAKNSELEINLAELRQNSEKYTEDLRRQIVNLEGATSIELCLLDGDGCIFSLEHIRRGKDGGHDAARDLRKGLLTSASIGSSLCTLVYMNQTGLHNFLVGQGACTSEQFNAFVMAFNESAELFCIVDVGGGKEAADAKIREMLKLFAPVHQIKRLIFGGGHDSGYRTVLESLRTSGHLNKLILLDYGNQARNIDALGLPCIQIPDLFYQPLAAPPGLKSLPPQSPAPNFTEPSIMSAAARSRSPTLPSTSSIVSRRGSVSPPSEGLSSPQLASREPAQSAGWTTYSHKASAKPAIVSVIASKDTVIKQTQTLVKRPLKVDRSKPILHQDPKICNDHYLNEKCYTYECPWSHEYELSAADITSLRGVLKSIPCKGRGCRGDDCWYRHDSR